MDQTLEKTQRKISKAAYNSDPFSTTWAAIKKILHTNGNTLFGMVFFDVLLILLIIMVIGALSVSGLAYLINHSLLPTEATSALTAQVTGLSTHINDISIYLTWIIGVPILVFAIATIQTLVVNLTVKSALGHEVGFSAVLKQSIKSVPAMIGWFGLTTVGILTSIGLLTLSLLLGPISLVLIFIAALASVYLYIVFAFTPYFIVEENASPVSALKQSLGLAKGRFLDAVGILAVAAIVAIVPGMVLNYTGFSSGTNALAIVNDVLALLSLFAVMAVGILSYSGVAERFVELRKLKAGDLQATKTSPLNYVAILGFLVLTQVVAHQTLVNSNSPQDGRPAPTKQVQQSPYQSDGGGGLPAQDGQDAPNFN